VKLVSAVCVYTVKLDEHVVFCMLIVLGLITSANEMFSCLLVGLFVCLLTRLLVQFYMNIRDIF